MMAERPQWPMTIGTVGVVLGALLVLDNLDELVTLRWTATEWRQVFGPYVAEWIARTTPSVGWRLGAAVVEIGLGVLLIGGSVALRRRTRRGVARCRLWAWLAVAWILVAVGRGTVWLLLHARELPAAADDWRGYAVLGLGLAIVLLLAFPVFLLVWLSQPAVRKEVDTWTA
jgi:hypothetical protein